MGQNYHIYEVKQRKLAEATGLAISKWASLEYQVLYSFAHALTLKPKPAARLLTHVKTFSLVLELAATAMRDHLKDRSELVFWNSLVEYIRELSGDRNFIAHTAIVAHSKGHPDRVDWALVEPKIGPAVTSYLAGTEKIPPMSLTDVQELANDIQQAIELTVDLNGHLDGTKPSPSPDRFSQPVPRRRPPRKERLAGDRKAP